MTSKRRRHGFTLIELLTVIVTFAMILAMLLPTVQMARETARKIQCVEHQQTIIKAIHEFHDCQTGLPPSMIGFNRRLSFWGILYPYVGQSAIYEKAMETYDIDGSGRTGINRFYNHSWWSALEEHERKAFGSVFLYHCPARRSVPAYVRSDIRPHESYMPGPQNDYAIIGLHRYDAWPLIWDFGYSHWSWAASYQIGPFRCALTDKPIDNDHETIFITQNAIISDWSPRDTIDSWWTDGASNTLVLGEKHIPTDLVGRCDPDQGEPGRIDCSYLTTGRHKAWHNVIQTFAFHYEAKGMFDEHWYLRPLARNPMRGNDWEKDFPNENDPHSNAYVNAFSLGGCHPGIVNMGLGDGSVRSVSVACRPLILLHLSHVNDGQVCSLP